MNYLENLIAKALQSGATSKGYNMKKANRYLATYSFDRRYKLYARCGTCSNNYNEHGVVQYMRRLFEYEQSKEGYLVKPVGTWFRGGLI